MVRTHVKLRDLNTNVPVLDDRSIEVLASGHPMHHGAQFAAGLDSTKNGNTTSSWMEVDVIWSLWDWRQAADGVKKRCISSSFCHPVVQHSWDGVGYGC